MATVVDLSGNYPQSLVAQARTSDYSLTNINRTSATGPNTVLTPLFVGEHVENTADHTMWVSIGLTNADWAPFTLGREDR